MADTALTVEVRAGLKKGAARKLRAAGRIPGVVYGRGKPSLSITLDPRVLEKLLKTSEQGLNTLIDLDVAGGEKAGKRVVLVKELQRDPVRGGLLHADLYEVDLTKTVEVEVPIHLAGRPRGVEMGGILDQTLRVVEIECLPRNIPGEIEFDVSELDIGDVVHVRDLPLPPDVELLTDANLGVAHVVLPAAEEAAEAVEAEAAPAEEGEAAAAEEGAEEKGEARPEKGEKKGE